ncbi:SpaA isopeptide-forming pilin-related protein [Streptococcus suis]|nr:SpaA isopeptide-forming pilin-related protein [Streptococcus suis]
MTFNQAPSYRNRNKNGKKRFKKSMVVAVAGVTVFAAGTTGAFEPFVAPFSPQQVQAAELKNGKQIGTLNNVPVVQSTTTDMSSDAFQSLVDSILEDQNLDKVKYVADKIQWNSNTEVKGVGGVQVGEIVSIFGTNIASFLMADGYVRGDVGAYLNPGQSLAVTNVGTITNIDTGEKIPVDLIITHEDVVHGADGWSNKDVAMAIKNQNSVITVGVAVPTGGGVAGGGSGQTEDGGSAGGAIGTGRAAGYIEQTTYTATLVRSDTKIPIPNEEVLMAMKVSDIDGSQLAAVGRQGAFGYIVSPDTNLTIRDGGLVTTTSAAINQDSTQLSPASYVVLKNFNSNGISYAYTDGAGNHLDIVTGLFGNTGFKVNADTTGSLEIVKSGTKTGTSMWNNRYTLAGNRFRVTDTKTGQTYEGVTDATGKVVITNLPLNTPLTVEEVGASPGFNKTFQTQTVTLSQSTPKRVIDGVSDQVLTVTGTNDEITGQIKIVKRGTQSGTTMWNNRYTLAGNRFRLTETLSGKVYEITTDAKGQATLPEPVRLGIYEIEEISASPGFVRTFKKQKVDLKQDGKLEVVVEGTNDEIVGQNTLEKLDKDTGKNSQGQAVLINAEYALYYNDNSTGSSPHKKDQPVKWADVPKAIILKGEKVTSSIINGQTVEHGDNIVINVDDKELMAAVGNLALGKYYWKEVNAPEGYGLDGIKHEFEIKKKDDVTVNVVTENVKSLEQIIKAKISIHKIAQASGDGSHSGINDITFKATPINDTQAEAFEFSTGIKDDEDGYATAELIYGDWKIEEVEAPEGYNLIEPVYVHMSYDAKTDLYTITASHNEDGSKPFSKRTFSQSDDQEGRNTNAKGSIAGVLTSSNAVISLSKMTLKDNATPPPPTPEPPTPPEFQPEKFDLSEAKFDITGDKLMDDDSELKDEYGDTNKDPYADKSDNNEPQNLNTKTVKRGDTIYYQVWLDATQLSDKHDIAIIGGTDDYDEKRLNILLDKIVGYDSVTGEAATQLFDITNSDGKLTIQTKADLVKDGKLDATKFLFGRYYKFEIPATVKEDVIAGEDIVNTASQFVTFKDGKTTEKPTQKRVNKVEDPTPPEFQPEKFDLSEAKFDITGDKLMDDDSELKDEYGDTNKDPYADKSDNNEPQNLNTKTVKRGDTIYYQVWLDATQLSDKHDIAIIGGTDDYDEKRLNILLDKIVGYDSVTGEAATQLFDITNSDGKLTIQTKADLIKDGKLDATKFLFGRYYKFEIPATVKDDVVAGEDIVNTASQFVTFKDGKTTEKPTQKRVNKVEDPKPQPHKFILDKAGYDVKGTSLLDDDSELKDRYADTNQNPYADKKDNNEADNINTDTVKAGKVLHYQVWIDTTIWNKNSLLQTVGGTDNYDERYVSVDIAKIKIYNKKTGKEVTDQFSITDKDGKLTFLPTDSVKKDYKTADGKIVKILDTSKFELGVLYQVEIPATVKQDVPDGIDIENTASQTYVDVNGKTNELPTEKRVNKTPKETPKAPLPSTGQVAGYGLTLLGLTTLFAVVEWRTQFFRKILQKVLKQIYK